MFKCTCVCVSLSIVSYLIDYSKINTSVFIDLVLVEEGFPVPLGIKDDFLIVYRMFLH